MRGVKLNLGGSGAKGERSVGTQWRCRKPGGLWRQTARV